MQIKANKFEIHILKCGQNDQLFSQNGPGATFVETLNGHNSVIFIRLWRSTTPKWWAHRDKLNGVRALQLIAQNERSKNFGPELPTPSLRMMIVPRDSLSDVFQVNN